MHVEFLKSSSFCTSSHWRCSNGQCISSYQHWCGGEECTDGSDELNCRKYCSMYSYVYISANIHISSYYSVGVWLTIWCTIVSPPTHT